MRPQSTDLDLPGREVAGGTPVKTTGLPMPAAIQPAVTPEPSATRAPTAASRRRGAFEERLQSWLLRGGLGFVLSYAATSSLVHRETFAGYFPSFIPDTWAIELLPVFAVFETLLAVGLMTYRYTYLASIFAGFTMIAIIAVNPYEFDVLFRNVAIACAAFALAVQTRRERGDGTSSRRNRWRTIRGRSSPVMARAGARARRLPEAPR
jgi:hypothetical protein